MPYEVLAIIGRVASIGEPQYIAHQPFIYSSVKIKFNLNPGVIKEDRGIRP